MTKIKGKKTKMIFRKSWEDFRKTGLLLFINQFLHLFGWVIVYEIDTETQEITKVFPARTRYRGFHTEDVSESYVKITKYLSRNIKSLLKEVEEE